MIQSISDWQRLLSFAGLMEACVLLVKLRVTRLARVYRGFSAWLLFQALVTSALLLAHPLSNLYAAIWACAKPLEWILSLAVVLEIHSLVLHRYPGIASLTRWAIIAGVIVSLLLTLGSLPWDFQNAHEKFPVLRRAFAVQRTIDGALVWSLLAPWLLMARFPIRLCRNVVVHYLLFSALVGTEAAGLFVRNLLGHTSNAYTNLAMMVATNLCLLSWILLLGRKGESAENVVLVCVDPERERHLIEQLRAFNRLLLRTSP